MWERTPLISISVSAFCMVVSFVVLQPADENHWLQHVTNASISLAQSKFNECPVFYYSIFVSCQHLLTCIFAISARPTCLRDAVCISHGFQINQNRYRILMSDISHIFVISICGVLRFRFHSFWLVQNPWANRWTPSSSSKRKWIRVKNKMRK